MAGSQSGSSSGPGNPTITELAPDVVSIGPDYGTGGVVFEVYDATANAGFRTLHDVGDALDAALRLVGAAIRLRRLMTP